MSTYLVSYFEKDAQETTLAISLLITIARKIWFYILNDFKPIYGILSLDIFELWLDYMYKINQ